MRIIFIRKKSNLNLAALKDSMVDFFIDYILANCKRWYINQGRTQGWIDPPPLPPIKIKFPFQNHQNTQITQIKQN